LNVHSHATERAMKAYSNDLRERVWRACHDEAMGPSEAAGELGVSRSFVL
jgi:transposase